MLNLFFDRIKNYILNNTYSINRKIFNLMTILACLTGLFATVASFVMDFNLSTKLLSVAVVLVSAFCFFLANNLKKTTFASVILILFGLWWQNSLYGLFIDIDLAAIHYGKEIIVSH